MPAAHAHAVATLEEVAATNGSGDWETPAGPADAGASTHHTSPAFIYRGYAEPHLRGQTCHLIGENAPEERLVVMACGCRASVPWWTLDPIQVVHDRAAVPAGSRTRG
jgi:hypothetical protein